MTSREWEGEWVVVALGKLSATRQARVKRHQENQTKDA